MKYLLLFFFLISSSARSQDIPIDYFANPLEIPLILAGSYGELRGNHFHSGLDIKTQQKEGLSIFAPADGYVSRINLSEYGYGKALYIKHPNGYTTVYAHLQSYAGIIQDYVKAAQYKKESYEVELFPEASVLPVKKGEIIGYTGDSGSSGGPHLHYEIRDGSQRPMNPMLFGVQIPDSKKPNVYSVFAYPIGGESHINQSQNRTKLRLILQKDGSYKAEDIKAFGKLGFGIVTNDQMDGASNKNGVYKITSTYNGKTKYDIAFEKFSFDETRYINRYIDYEYLEKNKSSVQKLFRETNNPLSIIKQDDMDGYIDVKDGFTSNYTITVEDFAGNQTIVNVPVEGKQLEITDSKKIKETEDFIIADQATSITKGKFSIYIPANSLYEDTYLDIQAMGDTLKFDQDLTPIHTNITITYDASNYKNEDLDKLYIGRLNYRKVPYYNSTSRSGDKLTMKTRTFGTYTLAADTNGPVIKPLNFADGKWISDNKDLKIKITDDVSGISNYRATVNGKFILMEYNYKTNVLIYDFGDGGITDTDNKLKIIVVDNAGNSSTFEATFYRKQQ